MTADVPRLVYVRDLLSQGKARTRLRFSYTPVWPGLDPYSDEEYYRQRWLDDDFLGLCCWNQWLPGGTLRWSPAGTLADLVESPADASEGRHASLWSIADLNAAGIDNCLLEDVRDDYRGVSVRRCCFTLHPMPSEVAG